MSADAFLTLLSEGKGAIATISNGQVSVLNIQPSVLKASSVERLHLPTDALQQSTTAMPHDKLDLLARKLAGAAGGSADNPLTFVATAPEIGSVPASGKLVSWSAIYPVSAAGLIECPPVGSGSWMAGGSP